MFILIALGRVQKPLIGDVFETKKEALSRDVHGLGIVMTILNV